MRTLEKSEAHKLFEMDIREKKRAGSGSFHKKGKGVKHTVRGIKNPYDLMKGKEKREYAKAGELKVTNIYDEIIPRAEFDKLETHLQKNMYSYWYLTKGIKAIQEGFGCGGQTVYDYLDKLGIPRKGKHGRPSNNGNRAEVLAKAREAKAKKREATLHQEQVQLVTYPQTTKEIETLNFVEQEPIINGLAIKYKGDYKAEAIQKILNKLDILLTDETGDFYIDLKLYQK